MKRNLLIIPFLIFTLGLSVNFYGETVNLVERAPLTDFDQAADLSYSREIFDLLYHFPVDWIGYSVATDGLHIYCSRWNGEEFYKYELDGTYIGEFTIPGFAGEIRDMTYDGEFFYGSPNSGIIYILDLANETLEGQINTTVSNIRGIAYDAENDGFWVTQAWTGPLRLVNRAGTTVETLPTTAGSMSGLAWENELDGGPYIWAYTQPTGTSRNILSQIDLNNGAIIQSFDLETTGIVPPEPDEGISGGLQITNQLVPGLWTFLGIIQNELIWVLEMADDAVELPLYEDFTGISSDDIPAGWERSHINWGVSYSNNAGGEVPEMRFAFVPVAEDVFRLSTPPLSIEDIDEVYLSFTHRIFDNAGEGYTLKIQYSFDNENWEDIWLLEPEDSVGPEILDLAVTDLGDENLMYISWVFDGYSPDINDWSIDNILITAEPPPDPIVLPYIERFDDIPVGEIPEDWTSTHINWGVSYTDNAGGEAPPEMRFSSEPEATALFRLTTPLIDISELNEIHLIFVHMVEDAESTGYSLKIQSSFDGETWEDIWSVEPEENIGPQLVFFPIEDLENEDEIYISWALEGDSANILNWYIDDIFILALPPPLHPPENLWYEIVFDEEEHLHVHLYWDEPQDEGLNAFSNGFAEGTVKNDPLLMNNPELLGYNIYRDNEIINQELVTETTYVDTDLLIGVYTYYVTAVYDLGESEPSNEVEVEIEVSTDDMTATPFVTFLKANYPNPFNPETTIEFSLQNPGFVTLEVFNVRGQKVRTFIDELKEAGTHRVTWNGRDSNNTEVSSGIYFYRMRSEEYSSTKKMILMK